MTLQRACKVWMVPAAAVAALLWPGCVERTAKIQTDPPGALVFVNDEEVGVSPVKFSFLWYGDYDIVLRKAGYETLKPHYRLDAPWYEWIPLDLFAETLVPTMIRDEHVVPTFALEPAETPPTEALVKQATELREDALFKGGD